MLQNKILQNFPGLLAIVNTEGKFLDITTDFVKYLGYQSTNEFFEEERGYYDIRTKAVEMADTFYDEDKQILKSQESFKTIAFCEYHNGKRWLLNDKQILKDEEGNQKALLHNVIDISKTELCQYFNKLITQNKNNQFSYTIKPSFNNAIFSVRESECLYYILRGKSAAQIAKILELSKRTIETYIDNIKIKLNCQTKEQVIACAYSLDYHCFIPASILKNKFCD